MKFVALFVLPSVGFALSLSGELRYPAIENEYSPDIVSDEETETFGHNILKKSIDAHPANSQNEVDHEGTVQEPCRLTLPTLELSGAELPLDPYNDEARDYMPLGVMPPRIPSYSYNMPINQWTPYDLDYFSQEPAQDYRTSYNSYMPYIYYNPVPSVKTLPPVISTRIHETIPEINDGYDVDVYSNNDIYFSPNVRAVRSREDDFLDQLEEDAVMPNVLPTMPFPYMRAAYPQHHTQYPSYQTQQGAPKVALFPPGSQSDCGLPFLVSCTPKISYGSLTNAYNSIPQPYYRKDIAVTTDDKAH